MLTREQLKILSNFLLDSAKIIFGSLVVGVFMPTAAGSIQWFTLLLGALSTAIFLGVAMYVAKIVKEKT